MPFDIPGVWPDPSHSASKTAPAGVIKLRIRCFEGSCPGEMTVRVVGATSGTLIAEGAVTCSSTKRVHELVLSSPRRRRSTHVRVLFRCGRDEAEGWAGQLWIGSAAAAGADAPPVTAPARAGARAGTSRRGAGARRADAATTPDVALLAGAMPEDVDDETPKTTRPSAWRRREPEPAATAAEKMGRTLDAVPDRVDTRDWFFQPRLTALPSALVNCDAVPQVLDQGNEGACTGFALAAVVNFLLRQQRVERKVSPFMLYELARRYDEWPGEGYEGSSARGAMKGWVRHGVCLEKSWTKKDRGVECLRKSLRKGFTVSDEARATPGGAFYRVQHDQVRDMHAAIAEAGAIYCTLMVHSGWDDPGAATGAPRAKIKGSRSMESLPIIQRRGRASDGHAVAIVGYTDLGFVIQNSWGPGWGEKGFALLPYEDFLMHATDVWVMQIGVPLKIDLWEQGQAYADSSAGLQRARQAVPLDAIRPYAVDVGNNGELSDTGDYWTTPDDIEHLFGVTIPEATKTWRRRRILLYLHGGLNDERTVADRVIAFREVMLANEIYPIHVMWESGAAETLGHILRDFETGADDRAGVGDWLKKLRDNLVEAKDRSLEVTLARPGGAMWREMKENARLASEHPEGLGAMQQLTTRARRAIGQLAAGTRASLELHVVGHSAGSIFAAYALPLLLRTGIRLRTLQLMAPAISVDLFGRLVAPHVESGKCPHPTNYVLSDAGERDDTIGPYGKSLLFLVSNAFEGARGVPLLGMERFVSDQGEMGGRFIGGNGWVTEFFRRTVDGGPSLIVAGDETLENTPGALQGANLCRSETHGGFDNDVDTMNSVLTRILGARPRRFFEVRDLRY
jgi:hypothetical protein